jgi:hypothetical protein
VIGGSDGARFARAASTRRATPGDGPPGTGLPGNAGRHTASTTLANPSVEWTDFAEIRVELVDDDLSREELTVARLDDQRREQIRR